jgi:hypothetical protein
MFGAALEALSTARRADRPILAGCRPPGLQRDSRSQRATSAGVLVRFDRIQIKLVQHAQLPRFPSIPVDVGGCHRQATSAPGRDPFEANKSLATLVSR